MQEIPRVDLKNPNAEINKKVLQEFGAADYKNAIQRAVEQEYIQREAALLSVSSLAVPFKPINGLNTVVMATAGGGVKVKFPIEPGLGKTGENQANEPLVPQQVALSKANVTYKVLHESMMEGGDIAENDSIAEGVEQLSAKMDSHFITETKAKEYPTNNVDAANLWTSASGDPYKDLNKAMNNIIKNSGIRPNNKSPDWFSAILPIEARESVEGVVVVDGVKTSLSELIRAKLGIRILYTREPFNWEGTWPLKTQALVIPTMDRRVGRFYTFDGGQLPSIFTEVDEDGKRVSSNSWMRFYVTPSERDGKLTENPRIAVIDDIVA